MKENIFAKTFFFICMPILYLPGILAGIYKRSSYSLMLFVGVLGLLSFLYIPHISNDRARYYEAYEMFKSFNFSDFVAYIQMGRPDFIFHYLIYLFAKASISVQFLFMLITSFTTGVWFYIFNKRFKSTTSTSNWNYFLSFLLIFCSFSLPDLFSGIRFYFASSFVILAFFNRQDLSFNKWNLLFLFIACGIHFSALLFLPIYLLLVFYRKDNFLFKYLFLISFIFLIIPKSFLISIMESVSFSGGYEKKVDIYLNSEDFITSGIEEGSSNYFVVYLLGTGWVYFAYLYLIFTIKTKSSYRQIIYLLFAVINFFYVIPTIYARYLLVLKFVFCLLIINEYYLKKNIAFRITLAVMFVGVVSNFIILRNVIEVSYFKKEVLFLFTILSEKISMNNFLY